MDRATEMKLEARLGLVAARMTIYEPFIGAVASKLPRRVVPEGTAWTDGTEIVFAKSFMDKQDDEQLFGLMLHEALHVVLMHMWRGEGLDHDTFNDATDGVINYYIRSKNYKLPHGGVEFPWITEKMDAEEVYARLMKGNDKKPKSGGGSSGNEGGDEDGPGGKNSQNRGGGWDGSGDLRRATDQSQEADVRASIITAAKMAKACGDKSLLVERILGGGLTPNVPWADEVLALLTSSSRDDFSYVRVNRRMLSSGVYLPAMHSPAMDGLVIGFDTSGSVGQKEADRMGAEITGIVESLNPAWVKVVYCDAKVQHVQHFERGDEIKLEVRGGGGTRFSPVFQYVASLEEPIAALIYLSDLQGPFNDIDVPDYPVIWGNTYDKAQAPFGKTVFVKV